MYPLTYKTTQPMSKDSKAIIRDVMAKIDLHIEREYFDQYRQTSFKSGTYKVKCVNSKEACTALRERLKKGMNRHNGTNQAYTGLTFSAPKTTLQQFIWDKELDNAYEFAVMNNLVPLFNQLTKKAA